MHHIVELSSYAEDGRWLMDGMIEVTREHLLSKFGNEDLVDSVQHLVAGLGHQENVAKAFLIAVAGSAPEASEVGRYGLVAPYAGGAPASVVGSTFIALPLRDNLHLIQDIEVEVRASHRRQGIGTALLREAERIGREAGRTTLLGWSAHIHEATPNTPGAIVDPTGGVWLPGDDTTVQFALARGYALSQAERHSVMPVPLAADLVAELTPTGWEPDYELVTWVGRSPEEFVEGLADLHRVMSTDAPSAEVEWQEEVWDAARVRGVEDRMLADAQLITTAARHRTSGELAGYTLLAHPRQHPEVAHQEDTLVSAAHRGRRLGMAMKLRNAARLSEEFPDIRRVHTWNADENAHMLAINVGMGFRRKATGAAWQKRLDS